MQVACCAVHAARQARAGQPMRLDGRSGILVASFERETSRRAENGIASGVFLSSPAQLRSLLILGVRHTWDSAGETKACADAAPQPATVFISSLANIHLVALRSAREGTVPNGSVRH